MPVTLQDLQQIATRADLADLRNEIKTMLLQFQERLGNLPTTPQPVEKPFYSPKEFGAMMGVSRPVINRWCHDGTIKALQKGGRGCSWLIPHSELERFKREAAAIAPKL
ncbi:MAG: helix-turn-helix domain-containing protein [Bacteroidota bacterium]